MLVVRWWVVAKPSKWRWSELFETGKIDFRIGRIEKYFPQLKVGDTVVGYESAPTRRLAALATVSKPFGVHAEDAPASFELLPLLQLPQGLTHDELFTDPVLSKSLPMRIRNQGTLFPLSEAESEQLLQRLTISDPAVGRWLSKK